MSSGDPQEEDIGESSSILTLTSTGGSTCNTPPPGHSPTPILSRPPFLFNAPRTSQDLSQKKSLGQSLSPSSPNLVKAARPRGLSRSQTLPRGFQAETTSKRGPSEIDGLTMDSDVSAKLRRWIMGIAIVDFDLDHGPVISGLSPQWALLPAEAENVAFSAFPDSLQFDQGSSCHSFRIRYHEALAVSEKRPPTTDGFIYGFSHFTQRRDAASKRGYRQYSLVILTQHPYPAFFTSLTFIFGPMFQTHGVPMLEAACHSIAGWPDPTPGNTVELGFLGSVLHLEIPHNIDEQQSTETSSFNEKYDPKLHILASSPPLIPPPVLLFEASLSHLWSIWECLVLCEPILIFGSSPALTSQAVWWLRDLLRPIPLAGDIRPYLTVQDGDHSSLVNKLPPKAGLLLGVTNPFFEKSCAHWPNTLSLGRRTLTNTAKKFGSTHAAAGPAPGWKTKNHKRHISKDRVLLRQLEIACRGDERAKIDASLALRRHFSSRTTQLITPLARYLNTLIPTPTEVTNARMLKHNTLQLKSFNSANFFASLKAHGSTLPFRSTSKRTEFYERWLKTPAFGLWLAQQEHIVQGVLKENVERVPTVP